MSSAIPAASRAAVNLRDFNRCARCGMGGNEWHHRRSRSVRDEHQHAACNGILLCGWGNHTGCHGWVHSHPEQAREHGWIVSRHGNPCEEPVFTRQHGWVLLDHEGGVTPWSDTADRTGSPDHLG